MEAESDGTNHAPKTPDPKKKKKEKRRGGSLRGGQADLLGTEPPPVSEPFVRDAVEHLNNVCGTGFPIFGKEIRTMIAQLLADGFTLEDIKVVNAWADGRWPGGDKDKDYWRATFLVPSKLYGDKFGEHLGVAKSKNTTESEGPWRPDDEDLCVNK